MIIAVNPYQFNTSSYGRQLFVQVLNIRLFQCFCGVCVYYNRTIVLNIYIKKYFVKCMCYIKVAMGISGMIRYKPLLIRHF